MNTIKNNNERRKMEARCNIFDLSVDDVERKLASLGNDGLLVSRYDDDVKGYKFRPVKYFDNQGLHLNRFYYAMASLVLKDVKNVLEIGTGDALSTIVLSKLFPDAGIYTVDLPPSDPMYKRWLRKSLPGSVRGKQRQKRLNRKNITYFEINTFFLSNLNLPKNFEFILVDGDHMYPQVSKDIIFAYTHIVENGFLFFHDYYEGKSPSCHVKQAVDWMIQRVPEKLFIFPMGTPPRSQHQKMALIIKGQMK